MAKLRRIGFAWSSNAVLHSANARPLMTCNSAVNLVRLYKHTRKQAHTHTDREIACVQCVCGAVYMHATSATTNAKNSRADALLRHAVVPPRSSPVSLSLSLPVSLPLPASLMFGSLSASSWNSLIATGYNTNTNIPLPLIGQ